ncbi:MAG: ATP-grasp domain-containing protein [Fibrobacter sp.]|nr:ATP-grasp domain-containing protein [Fibrobacter sp.]
MKKNILVFPCGSEIALEVYRAVNHSTHFNLIGANSIDDHGQFVFENYIGGLPFITDPDFLEKFRQVVRDNNIDAVYPAMDAVIELLKSNEDFLGCKVVSSPIETTQICLSKSKTYKVLENIVKVPKTYTANELVKAGGPFPVFAKPDIGYGSRGAKKISSVEDLKAHLALYPSCILSEFLPGKEYTVDCFSSHNGDLLFAAARERCRIMNGISVNTKPVKENAEEFVEFAKRINSAIKFNGAWFYQVKRDANGNLTLLEVASRFGGSSSLFRAQGINFALMSLFDAFDIPVSVLRNGYDVIMDSALDNKYKLDLKYSEVFVDFDDCIYLEKKFVNDAMMAFLYRCVNKGIKVTLLSRHDDEKLGKLDELLDKLRIRQVFDRIIHLNPSQKKIDSIDNTDSIFIDDSFAERKVVADKFNIPVFSLDMIEAL